MEDVSNLVETGVTRTRDNLEVSLETKDLKKTTLMANKADTIKIKSTASEYSSVQASYALLILASIHAYRHHFQFLSLMIVLMLILLAHC